MATYFVSAASGTPNSGTSRTIWAASTAYAVGDIVSPTVAYATTASRGYVFECTTGGTTGATEPTWVTTTPDTSTTTSGTAVFTCRNPSTWARAGVYLHQGLERATANGDIIVIQYNAVPSTDAELAADTSYTFQANVFLISASNGGGSSYTPTAMGTSNWIGNSTTFRSINLAGADTAPYVWGVTFRISGATADNIAPSGSSGQNTTLDNCYLWLNTSATSQIRPCSATANSPPYTVFKNCTFRFGNTGQGISVLHGFTLVDCVVSSAGSAPSNLFQTSGVSAGGFFSCIGCDFSHITGNLIANQSGPVLGTFERCSLGAGASPIAAQTTNPTLASAQAWLFDCASGDTHGIFAYADAYGAISSDTGVFFTSGAAGQSWKVTTTANASKVTPFITPWIDLYNTNTSTAITPYVEILRNDSTTAYTNQEVWAEWSWKNTSGSVWSSGFVDTRDSLLDYLLGTGSTSQANGAGLTSWSGESGTAWSGKLDSGSSFTPAEVGAIRVRFYIALTSSDSLRIDPQIRT